MQATKLFYGTTDTPEDKDVAEALFLEEHNDGNLLATFMLGRLYAVEGAAALSQQYYNEAYIGFSDLPDNDILYRLGYMYYSGSGVEKDISVAKEYFKMSLESGIDKALESENKKAFESRNDKANYYLTKISMESGDIKSAENQLLYSDKQDNEYAQYALGKLYMEQDRTDEALTWLHRAADGHDNMYAQYTLGKIYTESGDIINAEKYLLSSAEKDNEHAQYALGKLYMEQDRTDEALTWLHRAADVHENKYAQYALGRIYAFGDTEQEQDMASRYLQLSAMQGFEPAETLLQRINGIQIQTDAVQTRQVRNTFHAAGRQVGRNVQATIYSAERVIGAAGHIAQRTAYENLAHCKQLIAEYDADVEAQERIRRYNTAR